MKRDGEEKEGKEEKQKVEGRELLRCCCDPYAIVRGEGAPGPFLPCAPMRALTAFYSAIQSPNISPSYILPISLSFLFVAQCHRNSLSIGTKKYLHA